MLLKTPAHLVCCKVSPTSLEGRSRRGFAHSSHQRLQTISHLETFTKEAVEFTAGRCGGEASGQNDSARNRHPRPRQAVRGAGLPHHLAAGAPAHTALSTAMCPAWVLLTVCSLVLGTTGGPSQGKRKRGVSLPHGVLSLFPDPTCVPKSHSRGPDSGCLCGEHHSEVGVWTTWDRGSICPRAPEVCRWSPRLPAGTACRVAVGRFPSDGASFLPPMLCYDLAGRTLSLRLSCHGEGEEGSRCLWAR